MRGILLIGTLIALGYVAYLQMNASKSALEVDSDSAENKVEQIEQQVNTEMQKRMEALKERERRETE